jgi:hypothetical protein
VADHVGRAVDATDKGSEGSHVGRRSFPGYPEAAPIVLVANGSANRDRTGSIRIQPAISVTETAARPVTGGK